MEKLKTELMWTMKSSIRRCIIERDERQIEDWLYSSSFNAQAYLITEELKFTYDVVSLFNAEGLKGLKDYSQRLKAMARVLINCIQLGEQ